MPQDQLIIYAFERHANASRSAAGWRTMIDPLKPYVDVMLKTFDAAECKALAERQPLVFFDKQPAPEVLASGVPVIWIPMYDGHAKHGVRYWRQFQKYNIRFVAFSKKLAQILGDASLQAFHIQYYDNPDDFPPVQWGEDLNAFYWNRHGLLRPKQIEKMCQGLGLHTLYFRPTLDYSVSKASYYDLPARLADTDVVSVPHWETQQEYLDILCHAHLYVAPRFYEGIGLTVTEALASGAVVLTNNASTMNEYVRHGENGLYLPYNGTVRYLLRAKAKVEQKLKLNLIQPSPLIGYDWKTILNHDLAKLSENARESSRQGYLAFKNRVPELVDFMTNG